VFIVKFIRLGIRRSGPNAKHSGILK